MSPMENIRTNSNIRSTPDSSQGQRVRGDPRGPGGPPHNFSRRRFLIAAPLCATLAAASAPAPYGALPSRRQILWHELELYAFLHFTINTFTDREWGYGDEDPSLFHPTQFDADAIVSELKAVGMRA